MRRLLIGGAVALIIIIAALAGMWVEFSSLQAYEPSVQNPESLIGYHWLANNTEDNATVLAWWDYADGIKEIGNRKPVINEASENIKQTIAGYSTPGKPWRKIEYGLWYPYEPEEKVKDVATFWYYILTI